MVHMTERHSDRQTQTELYYAKLNKFVKSGVSQATARIVSQDIRSRMSLNSVTQQCACASAVSLSSVTQQFTEQFT